MPNLGDRAAENQCLVKMCLHCKQPVCNGDCEEYTNELRRIAGLGPIHKQFAMRVPLDEYVEIDGRREKVRDWMKINNVRHSVVYNRLRKGCPIERAVLKGKVM
jgi:hypothetical protein